MGFINPSIFGQIFLGGNVALGGVGSLDFLGAQGQAIGQHPPTLASPPRRSGIEDY